MPGGTEDLLSAPGVSIQGHDRDTTGTLDTSETHPLSEDAPEDTGASVSLGDN